MTRAATLFKSGNDGKARMHEGYAQYKYGFGAPKATTRPNSDTGQNTTKIKMHFHALDSQGEDGDCDTYTIELDSPLAAVQKGKILDIEHGDEKNLSREPFSIGTDVWLTVGDLSDSDSMECYLTLRPHEELVDPGYKGRYDQLVVVPALDQTVDAYMAYQRNNKRNRMP